VTPIRSRLEDEDTRKRKAVATPPRPTPPRTGRPDGRISGSRPERSLLVESCSEEGVADQLDAFNRPRMRRDLILSALQRKANQSTELAKSNGTCRFVMPSEPGFDLLAYVHSERLVEFVSHAWTQWVELRDGRDPMRFAEDSTSEQAGCPPPPLVPGNAALPRDSHQQPRVPMS
jgi:hypothetical protein